MRPLYFTRYRRVDMHYIGTDQRKLFVGQVPRNLKEEDIRALFSVHGRVDDVFLMRTPDGISKGNHTIFCAD